MGWSGGNGWGCVFGVGEVCFLGMVMFEVKVVFYYIDVKCVILWWFVMGIGDGKMFVDGNVIYIVKDLCVGLFMDE